MNVGLTIGASLAFSYAIVVVGKETSQCTSVAWPFPSHLLLWASRDPIRLVEFMSLAFCIDKKKRMYKEKILF